MKVDIKMPKLGESLTEGTILKWLKKPGDRVEKDETLLEVSTDKVDSEIPSPADGVLVEILAQENETVEVHQPIARIETEGDAEESVPEAKPEPAAEGGTEPAAEEEPQKPAAPAPATDGRSGLMDVVMPKLGESLTEGTIQKWLKKPGDRVERDETLLEVSTDKVDSEIPSPADGILREILAGEGETVEVNTAIARLETAAGAAAQQQTEAPPPESTAETRPAESEEASGETVPAGGIGKEAGGRFYSPLVRNIARKEGVSAAELESIPGSGRRNRVTKNDILNYLKTREKQPAPRKAAAAETAATARRPEQAAGRVEVIPMDAVRKKIAVHMRKSLDTSAHVYSISECDMTRVMKLMYARRPQFQQQEGFKLTVTPFFLHAITRALLDFPRVNASLQDDNIIEKKDVNLGIAVAAEKGLIVPVVKNAEEKSFRGLARAVNDLVTRTRENKLTLEDVQGATFSVTNYGIFGNIIGLPIINQPNLAIIGIGAIKKRPVVVEAADGDAIAIRSMAYISMSYDHRVVDGELGGRFMQRVVEYLEQFGEDVL